MWRVDVKGNLEGKGQREKGQGNAKFKMQNAKCKNNRKVLRPDKPGLRMTTRLL